MTGLVTSACLPFLPTPMGKGVVPDGHGNSVASARTLALQEADVILLLGARLNWILHFGREPRFRSTVRTIQADICPEEMHNSRTADVALAGDVGLTVNALLEALKVGLLLLLLPLMSLSHLVMQGWSFDGEGAWWKRLEDARRRNRIATRELVEERAVPLSYYVAFGALEDLVPEDAVIVTEGANTMDIGRQFLVNSRPRRRLDAGSFGTMGVGPGFAIGAAMVDPESRVICVEGDSAFGFSGMEIETMVRLNMPVVIVVFNNNGIYGGLDDQVFDELRSEGYLPPTALAPSVRYDRILNMFGLEGRSCDTAEEIRDAFSAALADKTRPHVINVRIDPSATRKAQAYDWLTRSKM